MNKVISILFIIIFLSSCATQQKTIELTDGTMVTQKKYDKMIENAFKYADKHARKSSKGKLSRKQIREFRNEITVEVDTLGN
jgi:hypothetical protein